MTRREVSSRLKLEGFDKHPSVIYQDYGIFKNALEAVWIPDRVEDL